MKKALLNAPAPLSIRMAFADSASKTAAQRADGILAESGIKFMQPSPSTNWNGHDDVRRTLINAFGRGISDERLAGILRKFMTQGSPVNATSAIIALNCAIAGPSFMQEVKKAENHREAIRLSKETEGKGFTPRESGALNAMGVPQNEIGSSDLSDESICGIELVAGLLFSLSKLTETQYKVICERFGVNTGCVEPVRNVAKRCGIDKPNTRAAISAACEKVIKNAPYKKVLKNAAGLEDVEEFRKPTPLIEGLA